MERVVITGASSGIGAACVEIFQSQGAEVIGIDRTRASKADRHVRIDLSEPDCGDRILEACEGDVVDGLINNAAIGLDKWAVETTADDFDRVMAVNVRAPFLIAVALHEKLAERVGFVVNIASVHAIATSTQVAAYAASKGALVSMTRALALEWAPEVRVNAVLPGAVDTGMLGAGLGRSGMRIDELASRHPLGRVGDPREIAEAVAAVSRFSYATGLSLVVDGGATIRLSTEAVGR